MNYTIDAQSMALISAWHRRLKMPTRVDKVDLLLCANALGDVLDSAVGENGKSWKENTLIRKEGEKSPEGSS